MIFLATGLGPVSLQLRVHAQRVCLRFPPRGTLPEFVAKARSDGMRGVVVVPFTPSDPTWPALGPPRSRPSTVSATCAASCPTLQRTSGRAMTSAARSAWLSRRPEASRLWPVEPAYVSGVRAAVWLARRAQADAVTPERVGRSEPSAPRSGAPAARPVGGQAQTRVGRQGRVRGASIM